MQRFEPWLFELAEYQAGKFRYSRSELFTKKEAKVAPAAEGESGAAPAIVPQG